jgi:hypothetical protein
MSSTTGAIPTPPARQLAAAVAQSILSLLLGLSLVMLARRLGGAFVQPLSGVAIVVVAIALATVAAAVRMMLLSPVSAARSAANPEPRTNPILFALPGLAAILLLMALTLRGTPAAAIALASFLLITAEGASWLVAYRPEILQRRRPRSNANQVVTESTDAEHEVEFPAGLVQQLTRVRENGRESVHATLLAEIPANDRHAALHIAFCPPLDAVPDLTAHALNADDADVRVTQAETFGARIEVRLPRTQAEKRAVLVEVLGSAICR